MKGSAADRPGCTGETRDTYTGTQHRCYEEPTHEGHCRCWCGTFFEQEVPKR